MRNNAANAERTRSNIGVMSRLIVLVKPLTGYMFLAIFQGLLGHLAATFITVLGAVAVLAALGILETGMSLTILFVVIALLGLLRGVFRYGEQLCNHYIAFKLLALLRDNVFRSLRRLCPAKLEGRDKGNLISVITSDVELLEVFYAHTISPAAIAALYTVVMVLFIGSFHMLLGLFSLAVYFIIGVVFPFMISKMNGRIGLEHRTKTGNLASFVLDNLRGLSQTIQYSQGEQRRDEMNARTLALTESERKMKAIGGINFSLTSAFITIVSALFLLSGVHLWENGEIRAAGVIIPFVALVSSFGPTLALAALGSTLQGTFASGNRVLDILDEEPLVEDIVGKEEAVFSGIHTDNLSFAYDGEEVLKNVSIEIPKGGAIGIIGKSGSGKSTLLRLFMRFWKIGSGEINIRDAKTQSNKNIDEINTDNLRDMESFVTQTTHLFHDSIAGNIRVAKLDATQEEIEEAAKKASIHDFIISLPKGYETPVGELGDTLSGGERQRIGLARAFLHDAPLMLLDEPTSNLDSLNEAMILKSLAEKKKEKTIVLVSHRKSTLRICDDIISIHDISAAARNS
ncbi:MAG: ABC transporter ATP-binding protein [Bacillota bacterium]|nr:ABC transporter ATP-binding protein [Bacillota bacterium]